MILIKIDRVRVIYFVGGVFFVVWLSFCLFSFFGVGVWGKRIYGVDGVKEYCV